MAQKVYEGKDPYVFVSYSHRDKEMVFEIINDLMLCACNIWYDTGIRSGEDWNNEIAQHLYHAECVLFMVTRNSISSEYVRDELNFAKSKQKKIYPVYLENIELPLSLELLLGRAQAISLSDSTINDNRFKLREKIRNNLPNAVFQTISDPFYAGERNNFYLENTSYIFPDTAYFGGEEHNSFEISMTEKTTGEKTLLFRYQARPAYGMKYSLNNVCAVDDPYFCNDDSKILIISLVLSFSARYPTSWPDFDAVLTIGISRIETHQPRFLLIDDKCIGRMSAEEHAFAAGVLSEIEAAIQQNQKTTS